MMKLFFFIVYFLASTVGAVCGIGGGVIIKPLLDAGDILSVDAVSFLSGCAVLAMTTYTLIREKMRKESHINRKTSFPLAVGAVLGGIAGNQLFCTVSMYAGVRRAGLVQSVCLLSVTIGTLVYTIRKESIRTHTLTNPVICALLGGILGLVSAFLGIGGGPVNLVILYYFFSMNTKTAAENSLYIIFFSQMSSLCCSIITKSVPEISVPLLCLMIAGGICGGMAGRAWNRHLKERTVEKMFMILMIGMILVNIKNIAVFSGI